jgi:hypothetical protein
VNTLMLRSVPWVIWPGKLNVVIVFVMPDFDVVCLVCRIILNDLDEPVFQKLSICMKSMSESLPVSWTPLKNFEVKDWAAGARLRLVRLAMEMCW